MPRYHWITVACLALIFDQVASGQTPSSTAIIASPNPSSYGQPVTLTATVTSAATGRVTFYDGVTILGIGTISGTQASLTTVTLPSGSRLLRAYYQGDSTFAASSSAVVPQTVVAGKSAAFHTPLSQQVPAQVTGLTVADLNGDHKQDLLVTGSATITIFLGNGDGSFQTGATYNGGFGAVADFNQDGILDLAVASGNGLGIMLGNGDGTFQAPLSISASLRLPIVVADFNGDGKPDIAGGSLDYGSLIVLFGRGDGTFQNGPVTNLGTTPAQMAVADFDGDGRADIAMTTNYNTVNVLLGNADGTFRVGAVTTPSYTPSGIIARDFNGDGAVDLLVAYRYANVFLVLPGKGDGTFGTALNNFVNSNTYGVAVEDYNGDGIPDVFLTQYTAPGLSLTYSMVLSGIGNDTFQATSIYSPVGTLAVAGDFNGDGLPDVILVSGDSYAQALKVLLGGLLPDLTLAVTDGGGFTPSQQGGEYAIRVTNSGTWPTSGAVQVSAGLSGSLTATSIAGTGWSCIAATLTCTRSDSLSVSATYPTILLKVNVAGSAAGSVTSVFTVSGGGETNTANDSDTDTAPVRSSTATQLSVAPNPSTLSQPVTLTAGVTAGAGGSVAFYDGGNLIGAAPLSAGQGVFTTSVLPVGSHAIRATYTGDSGHAPSTSAPRSLTVNAAPANGMLPVTSYQVNNPGGLLAGDVNNDGKTDLVSVTNGGISVLLGKGDGPSVAH